MQEATVMNLMCGFVAPLRVITDCALIKLVTVLICLVYMQVRVKLYEHPCVTLFCRLFRQLLFKCSGLKVRHIIVGQSVGVVLLLL